MLAALVDTPFEALQNALESLSRSGSAPRSPAGLAAVVASVSAKYSRRAIWKRARAMKDAFGSTPAASRQQVRLSPTERERLIAMPLNRRFPEWAANASIAVTLRRKTWSDVQHLAILQVLKYSFANEHRPASWANPRIDELAKESGYPSDDLELQLWQAAIAGLVERRRVRGQWLYTAVPERWSELPDYPSAAAPLTKGATG